MSVGLCGEISFQPSSKLSTINGWWAEMWRKRVPDGWGCSVETPSAKLRFFFEGTSMSWRSTEWRFARPVMPAMRLRRCWSTQDSAHGHSQTQRLLFRTVFAVALGANKVYTHMSRKYGSLKVHSHFARCNYCPTTLLLDRYRQGTGVCHCLLDMTAAFDTVDHYR